MKLEEIKNTTKDAIDHLIHTLESGRSDVLVEYLSAMAHFPSYSFGNVMLIVRQLPNATHVCGVKGWNAVGRFVRRGEKGIAILAPMVSHRRLRQEQIATDETNDESKQQLIGFRPVYVFDITQTEGEELPTFSEVKGEVGPYFERLRSFVEKNGIKLEYSDAIAPAKGISEGGAITLLPGMSASEEFATLAHELGHEILHRGERRTQTTKRLRETEAEAVAFVVCRSIGLEAGTASADYIQLYNGDAELLQQSLELVLQVANNILGVISSA
jgi:antirestriction protein ArdC